MELPQTMNEGARGQYCERVWLTVAINASGIATAASTWAVLSANSCRLTSRQAAWMTPGTGPQYK